MSLLRRSSPAAWGVQLAKRSISAIDRAAEFTPAVGDPACSNHRNRIRNVHASAASRQEAISGLSACGDLKSGNGRVNEEPSLPRRARRHSGIGSSSGLSMNLATRPHLPSGAVAAISSPFLPSSRQASTAHAFAHPPSHDQDDYDDRYDSAHISYPSAHWNAYHPDLYYPRPQLLVHDLASQGHASHHFSGQPSRQGISAERGVAAQPAPAESVVEPPSEPKSPLHSTHFPRDEAYELRKAFRSTLTFSTIPIHLGQIQSSAPHVLPGILSWLLQQARLSTPVFMTDKAPLVTAVSQLGDPTLWRHLGDLVVLEGKWLSGKMKVDGWRRKFEGKAEGLERIASLRGLEIRSKAHSDKATARKLCGLLSELCEITTDPEIIEPAFLAIIRSAVRCNDTDPIVRICLQQKMISALVLKSSKLRKLVGEIVRQMEDPKKWVESGVEYPVITRKSMPDAVKRHAAMRTAAGSLFIYSYIGHPGRAADATDIFRWLLSKNTPPSVDAISALYEWLGSLGKEELASAWAIYKETEERILKAPSKPRNDALRSALVLARALALPGEVARIYDVLLQGDHYTASQPKLEALFLLSRAGQVLEAEELVRRDFPVAMEVLEERKEGSAIRGGQVKTYHTVFRYLLSGYVNKNNLDGAHRCLRALLTSGSTLTTTDFNKLLKLFAHRSDLASAKEVFEDLRLAGLTPDLRSYTTLITLHANRRDVGGAEQTFEDMRAAGIEPDEVAMSAVINACVEAGSWSSIASLWGSLNAEQRTHPGIVNVMLKGLVLLGSPFKDVYRAFESAFPGPDAEGSDDRSWSTLLQSACDSHAMDQAHDIYGRICELASRPGSQINVTPYIYSILMSGYLRLGDPGSAQSVFSEMTKRGIAPTSVIHGMIIKAISDGNWLGSTRMAENSARTVLAEDYARTVLASEGRTWQDLPRSRGDPLENIIGPIIVEKSKAADAAAAESYLNQIVEGGVTPSIHLYTNLLDAFRRAGDVQGLKRVWGKLFDLAKSLSYQQRDAGSKNMLCIPLSIYIDGLSTACRHSDVAQTWKTLTDQGFEFDPHNWNHLVVSMVRAGDLERAFKTCETVLVPKHEEVLSRRLASERPFPEEIAQSAEHEPPAITTETPAPPAAEDDDHFEIAGATSLSLEPAQRPPNRRHEYRRGGKDTEIYQSDRYVYPESSSATADDAEGTAPRGIRIKTSVFERWRPADIHWRPSYMTIAVLDRAMSELEAGRSLMALVSSEEEAVDPEDASLPVAQLEADVSGDRQEASLLNSPFHGQPLGNPRKKRSPMALLARINSKYAKTVGLVMLHRRKVRDRTYERERRN